MHTRRQERIVEAGVRWAERDRRVRALLLKGSLARGDADERSDVDFVVVAQPGRLGELWAARRTIAEGLGGWLGGFDEVAWQAPHTFIGFCDGPVKVDFFFQEAEPAVDPWLRDGFRALHDPDGLAEGLRAALVAEPGLPDLADFDVHAWDWLWAVHVKLRRPGHEWLVYVELVKFVETMLLTAFGALGPEPWRGVLRLDERLPPGAHAALRRALPAGPDEAALRPALRAAVDSYVAVRARLAAERGMPLAEELAAQVLAVLRAEPEAPSRSPAASP
jgi:predicted nucleotidyltransferase